MSKKLNLSEYLENNNIHLDDDIERRIKYNDKLLDYTVDIYGNVYSYKFVNTDKPRILKPIHDSHKPPYCVVNLSIPGERECMFYVHMLVAITFIKNDDPMTKQK